MYTGEEEDRLTFVIPVFNLFKNGETLKRARLGLDAYSKLKDCDIIVSDYGSTDDTKELIESSDFTYLYTEPNEGEEFNYCKCGNHGIAETKTKYVCILGVDWVIDERVPELVINNYKNVVTNVLQIHSNELKDEDKRMIWNQVFYRRMHLLLTLGYDERFNSWGNEDKDLLRRCRNTNVLGKRVLSTTTLAKHITHPYVWRKGLLESANMSVLKDNHINNNKNVLNSYWNLRGKYMRKVKADWLERFIIKTKKEEKPYRCG